MSTTCLNYLVDSTKGKRYISAISNTKSFKRVFITYGSQSANFFAAPSKTTQYDSLLLPGGENSITLPNTPPKLPITVVALVSDEGSVNGFPLGQYKLMNIDEVVMGSNKLHHNYIVNCRNPKTNIVECILTILVEYWP